MAIQDQTFLQAERSLLLGSTSYIFMTSLFLFANVFGWDGQGFKTYLLTPIQLKDVLIGKNLGFAVCVTLEFLLVIYLYLVSFAFPSFENVLFAAITFLTFLFGVLCLGNLLSIRYPSFIDLSSARYSQKSTPVFLAFGVLFLLTSMPLLAMTIAFFSHQPLWWIATCFLCVNAIAYFLLFPYTSRLLEQESHFILEKIARQET